METKDIVKKYRKQRKMTQRQLALKGGLSNATISRIENGISEPDTKTLKALSDALNIDFLKIKNNEFDLNAKQKETESDIWINVFGEIAAGIPIECITDIVDREQISPEMAVKGEYIALRVRGDSMAPRINNGDHVIIRLQPDVENGDIAAVFVNGDSATLKKVQKNENGLTLVSLNPAFEPMYFTATQVEALPIKILGKLVELRAKF